ncbi:class I SAM-dependent methyltransferase [Ruminiclostridium cellulolyticum]|uniref:Methyltransferase small n=1 Tax=Ruminiclostridium cellulolyticum (strain ATCC 35319 / DSM 5812 / JCM 6584 / H10) TaxID=394503 RepID=B8I811_RUMCH|nr:methyltransferase [Ruminiclostridium cellulolyticum]ACL75168.1 methyltransferase small [Ruminiclostridium cellulolyticum H10]
MNQHYFTENPESEIKEKRFTESICGSSLTFTSVSGVFSFETKIDRASENLIKNFTPSGMSVLDIGCGYGAIGLYIKSIFPQQNITMIDVNNRALDYTKKNAASNNLSVEALNSNLFTALEGRTFDDIISNPPIAAGKELNTRLITESYEHLSKNGALWLVAFHNKGGSTLKKVMETIFGNVTDVDKSGGVRVYKSIRK